MRRRQLIRNAALFGAGTAFATACAKPSLTGSAPAETAAGSSAGGGGKLVAATFGGTWSEVHRDVLLPYYKEQSGADADQTVLLATEQISMLTAAKGGQPPLDVLMMDEGPALQAIEQGFVEAYDAAKSPNYSELLPEFQDKWGPSISMQCIGIAYNPERIKTVPTSWDALWNPEYAGKVGITSLASTLGTAFLVDLARVNGGSETNIEPAFERLKELLPNLGAVSANFGAHAALFSEGVVDIGVNNFNFVQTLRDKGIPLEFVKLETGLPTWRTTLHIAKGTQVPDLAYEYIDSHLAAEVQTAMEEPPYYVIPTNGTVPLKGLVAEQIAATQEDLQKLVFFDWAAINQRRDEWSQRFNEEIRV